MSRIGTFQQSQAVLADMMRNQSRVFEAQRQVASGHKGEHFKDIPRDISMLLGAKSVVARTEAQIESNRLLRGWLEGNDASLRGLEAVAGDLRQVVLDAIASGAGLSLGEKVRSLFDQAVGLLNARLGDTYIFGGTNSDQAPIATTTPDGLIALSEPPVAAFANGRIAPSTRISDTQTLNNGLLADQIGRDLLHAMQRILQFNAGTLPAGAAAFGPAGYFDVELEDNQRDFLSGELARLETVATDLTAYAARNGIRQDILETVQNRHEERISYTKSFVTEIEDVDMAEAIAGLNQDQVALQSSIGVMARIGQVSLLDFL